MRKCSFKIRLEIARTANFGIRQNEPKLKNFPSREGGAIQQQMATDCLATKRVSLVHHCFKA